MADAQSRKITPWASSSAAIVTDPEDAGITRTAGWPVAYEQPGSGKRPELGVFNQLFRELAAWAVANIRAGGLEQWDAEIDYPQWARCALRESKYVATEATGPRTGNPTSPDATGQTVWRLY